MRLVHFSDNHLGAGSERRGQDIRDGFARAIDRIIDLKPDIVINSGDMFDAVRPPNSVIAFASEQLLKLGRDAGIPAIIISGNHDAPKQKTIGPVLNIFREFENIHVVCDSRYEKIIIGKICISAVPHCMTDEILRVELARVEPDPDTEYNILVLHGVAGGIKEFAMADLSEQAFDPEVFRRGFDYVALGHYHNYTRVERMVYYAGSTERLSQAEKDHPKGFVEIDLGAGTEKDKIRFHQLESRTMLDLPAIDSVGKTAEGIIDELERAVEAQNPGDKIIRIKLANMSEETYRSLPFDRIAELKKQAFSLDVRFEKEEREEEDYYSDINVGRLDQALEKFLDSRKMKEKVRDELKKLAVDYLHRAEAEDT